MKKISLLFTALLLLSACGNPTIENFRDDPVEEKLSGILKEQTATDSELGTHFLLTDEEKVPLRSLSLNLSKGNYLDNEVEVIGFYDKENVFQVNGVTVLEVIDGNSVETARMVLYRNELLGFQIRHYSDWDVVGDNDGVIFYSKNSGEGADTDRVMISREKYKFIPEQVTEDGFIDDPLLGYFNSSKNYLSKYTAFDDARSKIGVDQIAALKVVKDDTTVDYYVYRPDYVYSIIYIGSSINPQSANLNVFQEMLGEFRFIPIKGQIASDEAAALETVESVVDEPAASDEQDIFKSDIRLETFESLLYHFKASYPADWYYAGSRSDKDGVLNHYGFSDREVTADNELLFLEVISSEIPRGFKFSAKGRDYVEIRSGGTYTVYTAVEGQNYRLSGDLAYQDLLLVMAQSITPIAREE